MREMKSCRTCGEPFEMSRNDYTVNCPGCRSGARTTERLTGDAWAREQLRQHDERFYNVGREHALAGKPRSTDLRAVHSAAYASGYERGERERSER